MAGALLCLLGLPLRDLFKNSTTRKFKFISFYKLNVSEKSALKNPWYLLFENSPQGDSYARFNYYSDSSEGI